MQVVSLFDLLTDLPLNSRGLPLRAKGALHSAFVCSVLLYGSET